MKPFITLFFCLIFGIGWGQEEPIDYNSGEFKELETLLAKASTFYENRDYQKALPLFLEALQITENIFGKEHPNYGFALSKLGGVYQTMGENQKAVLFYLQSLQIIEDSDPSYAVNLNNLANLYFVMGKFQEALPFYLEALQINENTFGKEHLYYGIALSNLGGVYQEVGEYQKALPLYLEALTIVENSLGKEYPNYGISLDGLARLYQRMGKYQKALPLFLEALEITENTLGKQHPNYGTALSNLANLHFVMGKFQEALPFYLEALQINENTFGKEHSNYGIALSNLGGVYQEMGENKRALPLYLEALTNLENSLGKEHPHYGIPLDGLARLYQRMGEYQKALTLSLESLQITENMLGKEHPYYGTSLNGLAGLYQTMGEYQKALPLFLEALQITENTLGKEHPNYGISLSGLAGLYQVMGKHQKALPLFLETLQIIEDSHPSYAATSSNLVELYREMGEYQKALPLSLKSLQITENMLGKEHPNYSTSLNGLAGLYLTMGEYQKALPLFLEALQITENTLGKEHPYYGTVLLNLANLHYAIGEFSRALPLYLQALKNTENNLGKKHPNYGIVLNGMADLYYDIGEYNKAIPLFLDAQQITENSLGKKHFSYGMSLIKLAQLYKDGGSYQKAKPLYLEGLQILENSLGKGHSYYGTTLGGLASLYQLMGENQKAISLYLEGLQISENSLGKGHSEYGTALNNLAMAYQDIGEYEKALSHHLDALQIAENSIGKDHRKYGISLSNLAELYRVIGEYQKALPILVEMNYNIINQIQKNFAYQTAQEKEKYIQNIVGEALQQFQNFNYLTLNTYPEAIQLATNNILTTKGLLLNATKNILVDLESLNQESLNQTIEDFKFKRAFVTKQEQLPIADRAEDFEAQKEELNSLERELVSAYSNAFGEEINYIKDYKQTSLNDNELAIEFAHFNLYNKTWTDSTMYVAYLYKKDWELPKVVNLFEEKQLSGFLDKGSINGLYKTRGGKVIGNNAVVSDSIYHLVWKPLEEYTKDVSAIYYSPDGLLHKIPFAALPKTDSTLLVEEYNLYQMGNTADVRKYNIQPNLEDAVLIGGVDYSYTPSSTATVDEAKSFSILQTDQLLGNEENKTRSSWDYLDGTQKEIDFIQSLLPKSKVLTKKEATETAFKNLSGNSPSVLHIATHGYFFPDLEEKRKDNRFLGNEQPYAIAENPLLRSGLILANANYAWQNGYNPYEEDDGILTALEISNLDLRNTDIVILSACESGLGDIPSSEGVYGLQRAFKMAGVKTIIMTLWEVPDAETAEFMKKFYLNWKKTNNPKESFKKAQNYMMKKYRYQPDKWAAFVYFE